jgi:hypothetical protein
MRMLRCTLPEKGNVQNQKTSPITTSSYLSRIEWNLEWKVVNIYRTVQFCTTIEIVRVCVMQFPFSRTSRMCCICRTCQQTTHSSFTPATPSAAACCTPFRARSNRANRAAKDDEEVGVGDAGGDEPLDGDARASNLVPVIVGRVCGGGSGNIHRTVTTSVPRSCSTSAADLSISVWPAMATTSSPATIPAHCSPVSTNFPAVRAAKPNQSTLRTSARSDPLWEIRKTKSNPKPPLPALPRVSTTSRRAPGRGGPSVAALSARDMSWCVRMAAIASAVGSRAVGTNTNIACELTRPQSVVAVQPSVSGGGSPIEGADLPTKWSLWKHVAVCHKQCFGFNSTEDVT